MKKIMYIFFFFIFPFTLLFSQTPEYIQIIFAPDYLPKQDSIVVSFNPNYFPKQDNIIVSFTPNYLPPPPKEDTIIISFTPNYLPPLPKEDTLVVSFAPSYLPTTDSIIVTFSPQYQLPAKITDLKTVDVSTSTITLTWTAPGDDGTVGDIVGGEYQIKYSTYLTEGEIASYVISWTTNTSPGNIETKTITGLASGTTHYFQIRTADELFNIYFT